MRNAYPVRNFLSVTFQLEKKLERKTTKYLQCYNTKVFKCPILSIYLIYLVFFMKNVELLNQSYTYPVAPKNIELVLN